MPRARRLIALLIVILAGGAFWHGHRGERPLEPAGVVRLAASPALSPATFWIAQERGILGSTAVVHTIKFLARADQGITREAAWPRASGQPGQAFANSLDLIDFDALAAIAPESITMIRGTPPR